MTVLIIGGVAAGMSAASKIKRENKDVEVIVLERGGEVSYGACGLPYYVSGVNPHEDLLRIRKAEAFIASGIDLRLYHEAVKVDADNKRVLVKDLKQNTEYEQTYDQLVIATGADAIKPNLPGINLPGVMTLKSIPEARAMKEALAAAGDTVAVIGGGYIGLEMVEALLHLGKKVVLFEMMDRLLVNFDIEISTLVYDHLIEKGVEIHLGEGVESFIGEERVQAVKTGKGEYPVDLAVLSIGVRPNTAFVRDTGINMLRNGAIVTDEYMRTSLKDVYAAGDCATVRHRLTGKDVFIALGTNANKQGKYVAQTILGKPTAFNHCLGTAMIKVCDVELGRTGLSEAEAQAEGIPYGTSLVTSANHAPYYPDPQKITIKLVYEKESKRLLGAQLVGGPGAALRTNVYAAWITLGGRADEMEEVDFGYAPPFAMPWDVMHIAAGRVK
jgi:NADPH-dependent 2,4-dienoyl-CoA reductase/sulfur reductase-like enzyme